MANITGLQTAPISKYLCQELFSFLKFNQIFNQTNANQTNAILMIEPLAPENYVKAFLYV